MLLSEENHVHRLRLPPPLRPTPAYIRTSYNTCELTTDCSFYTIQETRKDAMEWDENRHGCWTQATWPLKNGWRWTDWLALSQKGKRKSYWMSFVANFLLGENFSRAFPLYERTQMLFLRGGWDGRGFGESSSFPSPILYMYLYAPNNNNSHSFHIHRHMLDPCLVLLMCVCVEMRNCSWDISLSPIFLYNIT